MSLDLDDTTRFQDWMKTRYHLTNRHVRVEEQENASASTPPPLPDIPKSPTRSPSEDPSFLQWMQTKGSKGRSLVSRKSCSVDRPLQKGSRPSITSNDISRVKAATVTAANVNGCPSPPTSLITVSIISPEHPQEVTGASIFLDWMHSSESIMYARRVSNLNKSFKTKSSYQQAEMSISESIIQSSTSDTASQTNRSRRGSDVESHKARPSCDQAAACGVATRGFETDAATPVTFKSASNTTLFFDMNSRYAPAGKSVSRWIERRVTTNPQSTSTKTNPRTWSSDYSSNYEVFERSTPAQRAPKLPSRPHTLTSPSPPKPKPTLPPPSANCTPPHPAEKMRAAFTTKPRPGSTWIETDFRRRTRSRPEIPKPITTTVTTSYGAAPINSSDDTPSEPTEPSRRARLAHSDLLTRFIMHGLGVRMTNETRAHVAQEREMRHERNRRQRAAETAEVVEADAHH